MKTAQLPLKVLDKDELLKTLDNRFGINEYQKQCIVKIIISKYGTRYINAKDILREVNANICRCGILSEEMETIIDRRMR